MSNERGRIWLALASLYLIWGSTFLAIRVGLTGCPPVLLAGLRFVAAGGVLYAFLRARGAPSPTPREWRNALCVGTLLTFANGCVTIAEQWVSSGVAAIAIASVPLWTALFAGVFERWPRRWEWLGIGVGLLGVTMLQGGQFRASPAGAMVLTLSCASWGLGSILSRKLAQPQGLMGAAAQMLAGGSLLLVGALLHGDQLDRLPSAAAISAFAYLVVFGSIVGYSAYRFLLQRVRPTLATSYAYVNPLVAVGLGAALLGEAVAPAALGALALILGGVGLLAVRRA